MGRQNSVCNNNNIRKKKNNENKRNKITRRKNRELCTLWKTVYIMESSMVKKCFSPYEKRQIKALLKFDHL